MRSCCKFSRSCQLCRRLRSVSSSICRHGQRTNMIPSVLRISTELARTIRGVFRAIYPRPPTRCLSGLGRSLRGLKRVTTVPSTIRSVLRVDPTFLIECNVSGGSSPRRYSHRTRGTCHRLSTHFIEVANQEPCTSRLFNPTGDHRRGVTGSGPQGRPREIVLEGPPSGGEGVKL